jgi:streptogramin lyase
MRTPCLLPLTLILTLTLTLDAPTWKGSPSAPYPIPTANSGPFYITTGPDGYLWFTESSTSKIAKIKP